MTFVNIIYITLRRKRRKKKGHHQWKGIEIPGKFQCENSRQEVYMFLQMITQNGQITTSIHFRVINGLCHYLFLGI